MISGLNHIAIAVPDLSLATAFYRDVLNLPVSEPQDLPEHGVTTVFVDVGNVKIELISPLGEASPIQSFLDKNASGGIHHLSFDVKHLSEAQHHVVSKGTRILGAQEGHVHSDPKIGAHGKPVVFLHPKDCLGTLIELE